MKRFVCVFLSISILMNFIFASFSYAVLQIYFPKTENGENKQFIFRPDEFKEDISLGTDGVFGRLPVAMTVEETGIYTINFREDDVLASFDIVDSSGKILGLVGDRETNSVVGTDAQTKTVSVMLNAGETYYLFGYFDDSIHHTGAFSIKKSELNNEGLDRYEVTDIPSTQYSQTDVSKKFFEDNQYSDKLPDGTLITGRFESRR